MKPISSEQGVMTGADTGGRGPGDQDSPPPFFWGTLKLPKEGKKRCVSAREWHAF